MRKRAKFPVISPGSSLMAENRGLKARTHGKVGRLDTGIGSEVGSGRISGSPERPKGVDPMRAAGDLSRRSSWRRPIGGASVATLGRVA